MKLYVSSITEIINKERAESILKEIGINKIDGFSDCKNDCHCSEFKEGLEIRFVSKSVFDFLAKLEIYFLNTIKNLFREKGVKLMDGFSIGRIEGFFRQENKIKNRVFIFLDTVLKYNDDIKNVLVHEIMHIKTPMGHCDDLGCLFNGSYDSDRNVNRVSLCDNCKKEFEKILEEINKQ